MLHRAGKGDGSFKGHVAQGEAVAGAKQENVKGADYRIGHGLKAPLLGAAGPGGLA